MALLLQGQNEAYYIKEESIEAIMVDAAQPDGGIRCRVRTTSGLELAATFETAAEREAFVKRWAGKVTSYL